MSSSRNKLVIYLIYLAIIACAILIPLCIPGNSNKQEDRKETAVKGRPCILDLVTEENLAQFKPGAPVAPGHGESQPFKTTPIKEITVSAPAGAFPSDPDIRVSKLSGEEMQRLDKKIESQLPDEQLLWACDLDAGLASDEVLPGKFSVQVNLNELGIPEVLQPAIRLWRMDDKGGLRRLNTRLDGGVLRYEACQNSVLVTTICSLVLVSVAGYAFHTGAIGIPLKTRLDFEGWKNAGYPICFWEKSDLIQVPVTDDFGNFVVLFLFSKTEDGDRMQTYLEKTTELKGRLRILEDKATRKYDSEHAKIENAWLGSEEAERMRRTGILVEYTEMLKKDTKTRNILKDPDIRLPQSVKDVIKGTKLGNRFARDKEGLGMNALSYDYYVYIIPSSEIGSSATKALFKPYPVVGGTIYVNYDGYLKKDGSKTVYDKKSLDALCVTMAHEIGHAYEFEYVTSIFFSDKRFMEAIGSITEHWFAAWMNKKGYFNYGDTESKEVSDILQYAERDCKKLLCWPMGLSYPKGILGVNDQDTYGGYMLADFIQYLNDHKKKVSFDDIMNGYAYNKTFVEDMKDIFGIASDQEFSNLFEKFCWEYMKEIVESQGSVLVKGYSNYIIPVFKHSPDLPVHRIANLGIDNKETAEPFAVKIMRYWSGKDNKIPYNVFAMPSKKVNDQKMKFTFLNDRDMSQAKNRFYLEFKPDADTLRESVYAALFYRPDIKDEVIDSEFYYDVIALYQPRKKPSVSGENSDKNGLLINLQEQPNDKLVKYKYLSGMRLLVKNSKTGKEYPADFPVEECGKTVTLPYGLASISRSDIDISIRSMWFYKNEDNGDVYVSPPSDPVAYQKKNEDQKTDVAVEEKKEEPEQEDLVFDSDFYMVRGITLSLYSLEDYYETHTVTGHISIKDGRYSITVPAHSGEAVHNDHTYTFSFSEIHAEGKVRSYYKNPKNGNLSVGLDDGEHTFGPVKIRWTSTSLTWWNNIIYEAPPLDKRKRGTVSSRLEINEEKGTSKLVIGAGECYCWEWGDRKDGTRNGTKPEKPSRWSTSIAGCIKGYKPAK